jgi:hypothetical protein
MGANSDRDSDQVQLVKERVKELTWALVDEQISDDELPLLENLLLSDGLARSAYVECMQMHSDLLTHFSRSSTAQGAKRGTGPQVLGHLDFGTIDLQSPTSDEALQ